MSLLETFLELTAAWRAGFVQARLFRRAQLQALGALLVLGRATLSRILWTNGREQHSWAADYFLHSRAKWDPQALFAPLLKEGLAWCRGRLVGVAVDDTRLRKTGRRITQATYCRDPLSPPFHVNLMLGLRFMQAALLLPLHRQGQFAARAIPIRFEAVPTVKKPSRRAGAEAWAQYEEERKRFNLSQRFGLTMAHLRTALDVAGGQDKILAIAGDGSFCNRTVLATLPARTVLIARTRKDAKLCWAAPPGGRRRYGADKFTPEQVRRDERTPWQITKLFYGGRRRKLRYKQVSPLLWQSGGRTRPLRLFVHRPYSLSQPQERPLLLPPTRLSALHRPDHCRLPTAANLSRPLADRSQSPRRKGHLGCGPGPVVESARRPQTASFGGGRLQRLAARRTEGLRPHPHHRLRHLAQMAAQR